MKTWVIIGGSIILMMAGVLWLKSSRPSSVDNFDRICQLEEVIRSFFYEHNRVPNDLYEISIFAKTSNEFFDVSFYRSMTFTLQGESVCVRFLDENNGKGTLVFLIDSGEYLDDIWLDDHSSSRIFQRVDSVKNVLRLYKNDNGEYPENYDVLTKYIKDESIEFDLSVYEAIRIRRKLFRGVEVTCDLISTNEHRNSIKFSM